MVLTTCRPLVLYVPTLISIASLRDWCMFFVTYAPKSMLMTSFLERITNRGIEVTSDQFPNFPYDKDKAEELTEENPGNWDAEKGLLRSSLCLWVSCLIFTLQML